MKNTVKTAIECMAVMLGLFLIIHRRVFAACLTGSPMPEAPEWHKERFEPTADMAAVEACVKELL